MRGGVDISRGRFLRSLGASITGLTVGGGFGLADALQKGLATLAPAPSGLPATAPIAASPTGPEPQRGPVAPIDPTKVKLIGWGPHDGNRIAISFDDGPTPGVTNVVLDELKKRNLKSTFFMIGNRVTAAPDLARRVLAEGHEIGNHTYHHLKLNTLAEDRVAWELTQTQETIATVTGHTPVWLRPPYGAFRKNQIGIPWQHQLGVVLWSVDPRDWSQPGEDAIVETILRDTHAGSIILCHDLHAQTARCVGRVLDGLLERHFVFAKMSEFLGAPKLAVA